MSNVVTNQSLSTLTQSSSSPAKSVTQQSAQHLDSPRAAEMAAANQRQQVAVDQVPQQAIEERLDQVVARLNDFVQQIQRDLNFSVDTQSGRTVVRVLDGATREVIRQIPSEEVLQRIQNLEDLQGLLLRDQA